MKAKNRNNKKKHGRNRGSIYQNITIISFIIAMVISILSATLISSLVFAENTPDDSRDVTSTIYNYNYIDADSLDNSVFVAVNNSIPTITITLETTTETTTEMVTETTTVDYEHSVYYTNSYIGNYSGLTPDQINGLVSGTGLAGLGNTIYNVEQTYNVDAFFILSIASLESGYGTSKRYHRTNDLFGMIAINHFDSVDESINYFGRLISSYPIKYKKSGVTLTPAGIAKKYCPDSGYAGTVTKIMNQYVAKANKIY